MIRLDRKFPLAHYLLAKIHHERGQYRAAKREYEIVLRSVGAIDKRTAIPEADPLTIAELRFLTDMHLEVAPSP